MSERGSKIDARPTRDETDEDLLQYQREFLSSAAKSSTTVINKRVKRDIPEEVTISSDVGTAAAKDVVTMGDLAGEFAYAMAPPTLEGTSQKLSRFRRKRAGLGERELDDPESLMDSCDTHITKVLSQIVERDADLLSVQFPAKPPHKGFPLAFRRQAESNLMSKNAPKQKKKKKSIFAQQFASNEDSEEEEYDSNKPQKEAREGFQPQQVDQRPWHIQESERIDKENKARLAAMSEQEILEEQRNLLKTLDPSIVALLRKKNQRPLESKVASALRPPDAASSMEVDDEDSHEMNNGGGNIEKRPLADVAEKWTTVQRDEDKSQDSLASFKTDVKYVHPHQKVTKKTKVTVSDQNSESKDIAGLPIETRGEWLNMSNVEVEKMEWMREVPAKVDNKSGLPARFDLHGNLVPADADIPTHLGLHHHGDEPQRAGYRLDELFQLARSAAMQQRSLAINVLGHIVNKARHGAFHDSTSVSLIPALIEGGLVFLLRWALDDNTDATITAAVFCLHSLLVSRKDELAADHVSCWHHGAEKPSVCPDVEDTDEVVSEADKPTQTDAALVQQDVIKGLLKMKLLPRLRYLLEVWRPAATCLLHCMEILVRIARHSMESAYQLMQCPRLVPMLSHEFLPTTWEFAADDKRPVTCLYGRPFVSTLKLMRVICTAGRNMAASLVSQYHLMMCVGRYIAEEPEEMQLPLSEAIALQTEALRTWHVCLSYGLTTSFYSELYPILMSRLQHMCRSGATADSGATCALMTVLEAVVQVAADADRCRRDATVSSGKVDALPAVGWAQVNTLIEPIELILTHCLTSTHQLTEPDVVSCCVNFVATYYRVIDSQPGYNVVSTLQHVEQLCDTVLVPFLKSPTFCRAAANIRRYSVFLFDADSPRKEVASSLPELGALLGGAAKDCPIIEQESPLSLVMATVRLTHALGRLHKNIMASLYGLLLDNEDMVLYLRQVCKLKKTSAAMGNNHFGKFENLLQYELIDMARMHEAVDMQLYHQVALELLIRLHAGDEYLAHSLLSTVIFNEKFLSDIELPDLSNMYLEDRLKLVEPTSISSATKQPVTTSKRDLVMDLRQHWASIRGSYLSSLTSGCGLKTSMSCGGPLKRQTLLTGRVADCLIPVDWIYLPLMQLFTASRTKHGTQKDEASPASIATVTDTLRCVYMFETWRQRRLDGISEATRISRLMCTLLLGSDLFLNAGVQCYLAALLRLYCERPNFLNRVDFTQSIAGVASFYDLYMQLVDQFEAVSFGDTLFGCFVLFPLQQRYDIALRRAVWAEHPLLQRAMFVPLADLLVPLLGFLEPEETDCEMVQLYARCLLTQSVSPHWAPVLYVIAVHHVNRFCFTLASQDEPLRLAILKQVLLLKQQNLRQDIVFYKQANGKMTRGLELYTELPPHRNERVNKITSRIS